MTRVSYVGALLIVRLAVIRSASTIAALSVAALPGLSQTYQVSPDSAPKPAAAPAAPGTPAAPPTDPSQQLGWGSNIQNARLARAAQMALERGDHAAALDYAQRAAKAAPNDPQLAFLLGYAARLAGRYGPAVEAYQRGLKLSGGSLDGLSGLGQTYALMGRTDEAERLLKQVVSSDPKRHNDLLILGDLELRSGQYAEALEWLGRAERVEPAAQSELLLAVAYQHLNQMALASKYLEMAKNRAPNNPDVERSLAGFFRSTGNYAQAVTELRSIRNPKPDVLAELAFTLQLDGKLEESAHLYAQAAEALPRDLSLQLSAAQAQVGIGAIDAATPFLDRASRLDPNYYRLHAIRGEIAQIQDREPEAVKEYGAALASVPPAPVEGPLYGIQIHMTLQALYSSLDEPDLAHQQLVASQTAINALNEQGADRPAFLRLRALIKLNAGQLESALDDMKASLALSPHDPNSLQLDGDLLMKLGRTQDAIAVYGQVLAIDPHSRFALTSLGYAWRAAGDDKQAEHYFLELAQNYPSSYVPYLALGDLYAGRRDYGKAQANYARGYALAPQIAPIVAGGIGAALEAKALPLAGDWMHRTTPKMDRVPQILREKERYYYFTGDSQKAVDIGEEAIKVLPHDREVVVYLGYGLLRLERYPELLALTDKYRDLFPKEADLPLLAGYVNKHDGDLPSAVDNFTETLRRDPEMVTAYVNRGYVLNDLHEPAKAAEDFEQAIRREPRNGEAHMGLAFAELSLNHPQNAIHETQLAEAINGDSELIHTIRATAYGREGQLTKAAIEYEAAIRFDPRDGTLYLGLGSTYFAQRHFHEALSQFEQAQRLIPDDAGVYAMLARTSAALDDREQALHYVQLAEQYADQTPAKPGKSADPAKTSSDIYVATGEVLSSLGDRDGAMQRFSKALSIARGNRVRVRLAIARQMAEQERPEDAERQVALAQMEADAGDTAQPTGEESLEAADIFLRLHEYQLAQTYLQHAREAGAPDASVRVSLANSYLGLGETRRAAAELAAVKKTDDSAVNYQFLLAQAAVYQQEHNEVQAISAFSEAASAAGEDQSAQQDLLEVGANEGYRINPTFSLLTNVMVQPIFEDSTVYVLDSKLNSPAGAVDPTNAAQLPLPRSSIETDWITAFHLHTGNLPTGTGFFQIRNARGIISVPATNSVVHRSTTDYVLNFGLTPSVYIGKNVITFNSGVQGTLRRDSESPAELNQNLFRAFTYFTTSSFLNAISADGQINGEFGPFTDIPLSGKSFTGELNFRVGAPWSRTKLITGWGINRQYFSSSQIGDRQTYNTSSYIGLTHRFGQRFTAEAIVEDLRSWREVPFSPLHTAISQAIRPAGTFDFRISPAWSLEARSSYENTRGFHVYDMAENGVSASYSRPFGRNVHDGAESTRLRYPLRIAAGIREETFVNFTHGPSQQFRPYVSFTLF